MMLACFVATGFGVAAVYAFGMLRGKQVPPQGIAAGDGNGPGCYSVADCEW